MRLSENALTCPAVLGPALPGCAEHVGGGRDRSADEELTADDEPTAPVQAWIAAAAVRIAGQPVTVTPTRGLRR